MKILEENKIPREEWPKYIAFGKQVLVNLLKFTNMTLEQALEILMEAWYLYGLHKWKMQEIIENLQDYLNQAFYGKYAMFNIATFDKYYYNIPPYIFANFDWCYFDRSKFYQRLTTKYY